MTAHVSHVPGAPLLDVEKISAQYGRQSALENVSFRMERGEFVALIGPNGAGKSTLLQMIAGLMVPGSGSVRIAGSAPGRHLCVAYVAQRSAVDWHFPLTVFDAALMGRAGDLGFFRRPRASDRSFVTECLAAVGLAGLGKRLIGELSGGQQQRLLLARALAQRAELMLLDEPAGGLDVPAQEDLLRLIPKLAAQRAGILLATHDFEAAAQTRRVLLLDRRLLADGAPEVVLNSPEMRRAFGAYARFPLLPKTEPSPS